MKISYNNNLVKYCDKIISAFFLIACFHSPCLGAVKDVVKTDINGVPRPQNSQYDIGAYEYTDGSSDSSSAPVIPPPTAEVPGAPVALQVTN